MQIASSANRTWSECRSASEYTATARMPNSLHAQMTRSAISPLLAMRILLNISVGADSEERCSVFHGRTIFDQPRNYRPGDFALDLVHQLHRFNDTQNLAGFHNVADTHKRRGA